MTREEILKHRPIEHGVDPIFLLRWSPRAMSGEAITKDELMRMFEAARWATSAFNNQSWRFVYSIRGDKNWESFLDLLAGKNRLWCENAGALIVVVSKTTFDHNGKPSRTHSYDTGAAWMSLALQGSMMGLVVHGMQGFDYERAREELNVPEDHQIEAMAAVGRQGRIEDLHEDFRESESPKGRKALSETVLEGRFR